ncbi:hypothetical protein JH06_3334 [Blastocystis sp. subtype 4]|uniref:hypothetical protein n=1 Tax=Blastocystis sp. subtype 4 TaxID=944170 RepID=UPI0007116C2E|nr:hypothetical protein JH06_3334 [Blastocystis sp. subtype 4]KNB42884.1 hypothetical protein JH06_3334 [Blastocystis sp. subtype 4]|eukprot:XP_014526327.1 hypothetical protein JH06_3334 [Blastocystis sp. subtype 4]
MIGGLAFFMFNLSLVNVTSHFRDETPITEKRTLTIFTTVMKADDDPLRHLAQENCLSLLSELPSAYVIVFTDDKEWIRIAKHYGLYAVAKIEFMLLRSNEFGTPYLKAMYQFAMDHFESDFYGYVNADILLDSTIISSLQQIQKEIEAGTIENRVYAVGQRTNVQQEPEDKYEKGGSESAEAFVLRMLLKGHRYWDSAVDYHIVTKTTFDWMSIPDFIIGRSGYDLYFVQEGYLDKSISLIDMTNTVHCAHMLSKDGNRSGLKRETPDRDWNQGILHSIPGGCCQYKSFSKLADLHTVELMDSICVAKHGFEGYYDDSYYDTERYFIKNSLQGIIAENCFLVSENDVLGVLFPFCKQLTVIILNRDSCE